MTRIVVLPGTYQMSDQPYNPTGDYQPASTLRPPPLYRWPPRPMKVLKYLLIDLMFPWNYLYITLALICWLYFTPGMSSMATFEPGWIAALWLRNAAVLTLVAGGLHWWLYIRRSQQQECKFHRRWLDTDNDKFLWKDQVRDNMFWCYVSGITIATGYEAMTYWLYANGYVVFSRLDGSSALPGYLRLRGFLPRHGALLLHSPGLALAAPVPDLARAASPQR